MEIEIVRDYWIQVDKRDAELVQSYDWCKYERRSGPHFVMSAIHKRTVLTDRHFKCALGILIFRLKGVTQSGTRVIHLNGDRLDFRRENLALTKLPTLSGFYYRISPSKNIVSFPTYLYMPSSYNAINVDEVMETAKKIMSLGHSFCGISFVERED